MIVAQGTEWTLMVGPPPLRGVARSKKAAHAYLRNVEDSQLFSTKRVYRALGGELSCDLAARHAGNAPSAHCIARPAKGGLDSRAGPSPSDRPDGHEASVSGLSPHDLPRAAPTATDHTQPQKAMVSFFFRPRSRSRTPAPRSRSHVRIPWPGQIDNLDRLLRGRGCFPHWIQKIPLEPKSLLEAAIGSNRCEIDRSNLTNMMCLIPTPLGGERSIVLQTLRHVFLGLSVEGLQRVAVLHPQEN